MGFHKVCFHEGYDPHKFLVWKITRRPGHIEFLIIYFRVNPLYIMIIGVKPPKINLRKLSDSLKT